MLGVGGVLEVAEVVEQHEAQAAFAFQGIEAVGLQIRVFRRLTGSRQIAGELTHIAALPDQLRLAAMLSCRCEEACCRYIVGTVFDEDYLTVLRVLRYLSQRLVYV